MEEINLQTHESDREIKVERKAAEAGGDVGYVKIFDSDEDDALIVELASQLTSEIKIDQ